MADWTERTELLLGAEGVARLRNARVAVVGLGGVGAAAAEMLARAGVGALVLIDNDCVSRSNLNRQLIALHSTVGQRKTDVLARRLTDINPDLRLTLIPEYLNESNIPGIFASSGATVPGLSPENVSLTASEISLDFPAGEQTMSDAAPPLTLPRVATVFAPSGAPVPGLSPENVSLCETPPPTSSAVPPLTLPRVATVFGGNPGTGAHIDCVIDAIDTLSPKIALIQYCLSNGIRLVSSMGSGAKVDATKIRVADISDTKQCPLAHMLRKRLHKLGITTGFQAVYSEEPPRRDSVILEESRNKKSQVGTVSYLPTVFGCVCAQAAICAIADIDKNS